MKKKGKIIKAKMARSITARKLPVFLACPPDDAKFVLHIELFYDEECRLPDYIESCAANLLDYIRKEDT